jgi:hypothetical protein
VTEFHYLKCSFGMNCKNGGEFYLNSVTKLETAGKRLWEPIGEVLGRILSQGLSLSVKR